MRQQTENNCAALPRCLKLGPSSHELSFIAVTNAGVRRVPRQLPIRGADTSFGGPFRGISPASAGSARSGHAGTRAYGQPCTSDHTRIRFPFTTQTRRYWPARHSRAAAGMGRLGYLVG